MSDLELPDEDPFGCGVYAAVAVLSGALVIVIAFIVIAILTA